MEVNDIFDLLVEIREFAAMLQGQRLNDSGYKMIGLKIENLSKSSEIKIYKFLIRLQAAGIPIEPTE